MIKATLNKTIFLLIAMALMSHTTLKQQHGFWHDPPAKTLAYETTLPTEVPQEPDAIAAVLQNEWTSLMDNNLSDWEIWMGVVHTSVDLPGVPKSDDVRNGIPLGLNNDPKNVFSVIQENGAPVIKITGEIYGGLTTKQSYSNYHLSLQFKWGTKKFEPRLNAKRDSGILYHCKGEHGAFWNVWKASLEMQVQETDCGDFFALAGTSGLIPARQEGNNFIFEPRRPVVKKGRVIRSVDNELPNGEWNTLEVITIGDRSVHIVNGVMVNALRDARLRGEILKDGQIQIQSEGAEVYYRDIKIKAAADFPTELLNVLGWEPQDGGNEPTPAPIGKIIALKKTGGDGNYITAEKYANDNQLLARANAIGPWEKFVVESHPNGGIALKALSNNKYVQVQGSNATKPLRATGAAPGTWEQFEWKSKGTNQVALKSMYTNKWVSASLSTNNALVIPSGLSDANNETFIYQEVGNAARLSIHDTEGSSTIKLYPNPTQEALYVENVPTGANVALASISGQQYPIKAVQNNLRLQLDISILPKGVYVLKINSHSYTFVKQ